MSITINGATNTLTAASGLTIAGNTAVTGTLSATGLGTFSSGVFTDSGALQIGADIGASSITNATRKFGAITTPHYTNAQEKVVLASVDSDAASTLLNIGGGSSSFNSPTAVYVYAQAAVDTGGGSVVGTFSSTGLAVTGTLSATSQGSLGGALFWGGLGSGVYVNGNSGANTWEVVTNSAQRIQVSNTALTLGSGVNLVMAPSYIEGAEMTAPAAPAANGFRIFAEDNGAGKTRLMVQFATGAAQQLAIEP